jgi:WD repeat-containing protein 40A
LDQNIVTVGGGKGYLSFFDLRAQKYVPLRPGMRLSNNISTPASFKSFHHDEKLPKRRSAWKVSSGWLNKNQMYYDYFQGLNIRNAIYTHCYHANSTEIFVAGGPLQLNLSGSYAAIWK